MLATEYAEYYGIEPQREGEHDLAFRSRIAGALRDMGKIIEAHEAQADERFEYSDNVMAGVVGAIAQALQGVDYGVSGEQQVGVDIAAGYVVQDDRPKMSAEMAMLAMMMA